MPMRNRWHINNQLLTGTNDFTIRCVVAHCRWWTVSASMLIHVWIFLRIDKFIANHGAFTCPSFTFDWQLIWKLKKSKLGYHIIMLIIDSLESREKQKTVDCIFMHTRMFYLNFDNSHTQKWCTNWYITMTWKNDIHYIIPVYINMMGDKMNNFRKHKLHCTINTLFSIDSAQNVH